MLWLAAIPAFAQLSPQQLEAASAGFNSVSARQLSQIDAYLLCAIVGGSTPQAAVTASIGFQALSDRQLQNVIAYELSLIAAAPTGGPGLSLTRRMSASVAIIPARSWAAIRPPTRYSLRRDSPARLGVCSCIPMLPVATG